MRFITEIRNQSITAQ